MTFSPDAGDVVALHTAHADGAVVHDHLTGSGHAVNARAAAVLPLLDGRRRWRDVIAAEPQAFAFVTELEAAGMVRVRRAWRARLHPATWPSFPGPALRRWPPTVRGVAAAAVTAARPALVVGAVCSVPLLVLAPSVVALIPLVLVLAALLTTVVHELGHVVALRATGIPAPFVSAERGRVAVAHGPGAGRAVAAAGPVAGAAAALAFGAVPIDGLAVPTAVLLALGHLASLAPGFADGDRFWTGLRR